MEMVLHLKGLDETEQKVAQSLLPPKAGPGSLSSLNKQITSGNLLKDLQALNPDTIAAPAPAHIGARRGLPGY